MCCRGMIPRAKAEPGQEKQGARGCSTPGRATQLRNSPREARASPGNHSLGWRVVGQRERQEGNSLLPFPAQIPRESTEPAGRAAQKSPQKVTKHCGGRDDTSGARPLLPTVLAPARRYHGILEWPEWECSIKPIPFHPLSWAGHSPFP